MIQTYDKLKIVTSSTNLVKSTITFCEISQEKINQGKQQLSERISFHKEKDDLNYEHLIHQDDLLSEDLEKERSDMITCEKQFEKKIDDVSNKINSNKQNVNDLKLRLNELKIESELMEKKNNAAVIEKELVLKQIDAVRFKLNTLEESIKKEKMEHDEKIKSLNGSIEINNNR